MDTGSSPRPKKLMMDMVATKQSRPNQTVAVRPVAVTNHEEIVSEKESIVSSDKPKISSVRYDNGNPSRKMGCGLWFVGFACAAILLLVIGGLIAAATISITPNVFSGKIDTSVVMSQSINQGELRFFTATQTFTADKMVVAQQTTAHDVHATGTVRFFNNNLLQKNFPANTKIQATDANGQWIVYVTKTSITIPGGRNKKPGQKDVVVTAEKPGSYANSGLRDFVLVNTVSGITIRSLTSISGGMLGSDRVGDPAQVELAKNELQTSLLISDDLINRMKQDVPKEKLVIPISFMDSTPTFSIESRPDDVNNVYVVAHKTVTLVMVNRNDFARVVGDHIGIEKGVLLTISELGDLSFTTGTLASAHNVPNTLTVRIAGSPTIYGYVDTETIRKNSAGKNRGEVKTYLNAFPEIKSISIRMLPFWRSILPTDPQKIAIKERY